MSRSETPSPEPSSAMEREIKDLKRELDERLLLTMPASMYWPGLAKSILGGLENENPDAK